MDFSLEQVLYGDLTNHLLVTFAGTPNNLNSEGMFHWGPITKDSTQPVGTHRQRASAQGDSDYIFHSSQEKGLIVAPAEARHFSIVLAFGPVAQPEETPGFFQRF